MMEQSPGACASFIYQPTLSFMKVEPNEAFGVTVTVEPGDSLDAVPASHRGQITAAIRRGFANPRAYLRQTADLCQFPKMAEWLRAVTEPNDWCLELHRYENRAGPSGRVGRG